MFLKALKLTHLVWCAHKHRYDIKAMMRSLDVVYICKYLKACNILPLS